MQGPHGGELSPGRLHKAFGLTQRTRGAPTGVALVVDPSFGIPRTQRGIGSVGSASRSSSLGESVSVQAPEARRVRFYIGSRSVSRKQERAPPQFHGVW